MFKDALQKLILWDSDNTAPNHTPKQFYIIL